MKSNIFLAAIFFLIAGGIYMFTNKDNVGTTTLNQGAITGNTPIEEKKNLSLSPTEWQNALVGTWDYSITMESKKKYHIIQGQVEYLPNGKFIRYATHEYYTPYWNDQPIRKKFNEKKIAMISGGSLKGNWKVVPEENRWEETTTSCKITHSEGKTKYRINTCNKYFKGTIGYGHYATDKTKLSLNYFMRNVVSIEGRNYEEGTTITYYMSK